MLVLALTMFALAGLTALVLLPLLIMFIISMIKKKHNSR